MSGNPTGSNVVPMPHALAPASNPPQPPMPFPMWGGGGSLPWGPGCCPPGGMDALLQCYCDVQAATKFICSVMVTCIQTNPAVVEAILAAIAASGSSVPLIGVTNGSAAQPGQVGEQVLFNQTQTLTVPTTGAAFSFNMGVLQPGSWYLTSAMFPGFGTQNANYGLVPSPAGFSSDMEGALASTTTELSYIISQPTSANISVPTLLAFQVNLQTATSTTGPVNLQVVALRVR